MAGSRDPARQQLRGGMEGPRAAFEQRAAGSHVGGIEPIVMRSPAWKRVGIGHQRIENARRGEHAGQARAGMRAGARPDRGLSMSSLLLCGRNQALCVSTGSSPKAAPRNDEQPVLEILRRQHART